MDPSYLSKIIYSVTNCSVGNRSFQIGFDNRSFSHYRKIFPAKFWLISVRVRRSRRWSLSLYIQFVDWSKIRIFWSDSRIKYSDNYRKFFPTLVEGWNPQSRRSFGQSRPTYPALPRIVLFQANHVHGDFGTTAEAPTGKGASRGGMLDRANPVTTESPRG